MSRSFDAIVIGAGQSGPFLAARLVAAGQRVALIEREHLGGTCVNDGCMPTKTLVASARAAHIARRAADFGVVIPGPVTIDMARVKARVDNVVHTARDNLRRWLAGLDGLTLIDGHARFTGPHELAVGRERFTAPRIFVNTGGRPVLPDWPGLAGLPYLTNTSVLALDRVPAHLLVAGGSYIGLEFAQVYRRFGAEVTVVEVADRLIAREDPEVSQAVRSVLEAEGIRFVTGAREVTAGRSADGGIRLDLQAGGQPLTLQGSDLLVATGRRPNTDDLGLDQAGIEIDARGFIRVDDQLRTSVEGVWALGDVNGQGAFTHTSYNDFEIVAANLLEGGARRLSDRIPVYALFTDPPLARIGMNDAQARASGRRVLAGMLPMTRVGRARERDETQGFMKVLVDADTQRILGATLFCIEGDEAIHALLDTMAADQPCTVIQRCVHIHPTVSELIPTLLGSLAPLD
ncbi:FAD-containing oxidoreductase [Aquabacterium sp.]|uniref:FAD-containing oxidoreductase n=1 Tax=Aquabacterium sp. TaxID=1872578 RepID=UPI003783A681